MATRESVGDRRLGVVGIIVTRREDVGAKIQDILSEYASLIVGRMGIPYRERGVSAIALIVDGDTDRLGALTGRLGSLDGVYVRSALAPPVVRAPDQTSGDT